MCVSDQNVLLCSEIFPYLVMIIGLENVLVITKSVVSTPVHLDVKIRVAQGWTVASLSCLFPFTLYFFLLSSFLVFFCLLFVSYLLCFSFFCSFPCCLYSPPPLARWVGGGWVYRI